MDQIEFRSFIGISNVKVDNQGSYECVGVCYICVCVFLLWQYKVYMSEVEGICVIGRSVVK